MAESNKVSVKRVVDLGEAGWVDRENIGHYNFCQENRNARRRIAY
jgi:hypothetical protein